jgi:hypothetical protein
MSARLLITPVYKKVSASFLIDTLSVSPTYAYSHRKLRSAYAGKCIQVTTSAAGNATQDIGFTGGGDLDAAALASFIGSNTGYTNILYDQMVNSNASTINAVPNTPIIRNSGTNNTLNSHPISLQAAASGASCQAWQWTLLANIIQPYTIVICFKWISFSQPNAHMTDGVAGGTRPLIGNDQAGPPPHYQQYAGGTPHVSSTTVDTTNVHTMVGIFDGANSKLVLDGSVIVGPVNSGADFMATTGQMIGAGATPVSTDMIISEYMVFPISLGATDQAAIRSSWQSYWGAA